MLSAATSLIGSLSREADSRLPAMLDDLRTLVGIESATSDKASFDRAQDFLTQRLEWAGAEVERYSQTGGDPVRAENAYSPLLRATQ